MRKPSTFVVLFLLTAAPGIAHAQRTPTFEDCPVVVQAGHAPTRLVPDARSRAYRSAVADAARGPVNFAGHYVLAEWGCGAGCIMAAAVDTKTGRVSSLPFTVSDWPPDVTEPLMYRANSCLLVVQGSRDESKEHGTYYFTFDGDAFHQRAKVITPSR